MEFSWKIVEMERQPSDDYVFMVHFTIDAMDGEFTSQIFDSIELNRPEKLLDFNSLTEDLVIEWIKNKLGEENIISIENQLKELIEEKKNPKVLFGLPWEN